MKFFKKIKQFLIILNKKKNYKKKYSDDNLLEIDTYSNYFVKNKNEKKNSNINIFIKEMPSNRTEKTDNTDNKYYLNKNQIIKINNKGYRKYSYSFDSDFSTKVENKYLFSPSSSNDINGNSIENSFDDNNNSI